MILVSVSILAVSLAQQLGRLGGQLETLLEPFTLGDNR